MEEPMVQRKRPTPRGSRAEPENTDLLTRAARIVGTALGSISVRVRGKQSDGQNELGKATEAKPPRKAAAKKRTVRKAGTKASPKKGTKTARAKKDKLQP
jgi:hypothetical protein